MNVVLHSLVRTIIAVVTYDYRSQVPSKEGGEVLLLVFRSTYGLGSAPGSSSRSAVRQHLHGDERRRGPTANKRSPSL
jgi:hypothetical protein